MRVLSNNELIYVSGGGENTADIVELSEDAATNAELAARTGGRGYSGWKDGEIGAALGDALYNFGKWLGWWG